jgi:predicted Zn-dependent protease
MAMANFSIYVFSGLMNDLDDDELAIVLGHEIAHATYEHSRRQWVGMLAGIAGQAAAIGASFLDNDLRARPLRGRRRWGHHLRQHLQPRLTGTRPTASGCATSGGRLRLPKAPDLWRKFAAKYATASKVSNFFFGDHSLSLKRASDLEREIANNYSDPAKDPPTKTAVR